MLNVYNHAARVRDANQRSVASRLALGDFMGAPSYQRIKGRVPVKSVKGRAENIRKMFMDVGKIGSYNVEMVIAQAFFMPRTTDPDAAPTILLIEGLQRGANQLGAKLEVSGVLEPATVQMLRKTAGKNWMSKTWAQLYGELYEMMKRGKSLAPSAGDAMGYVPESAFTTIPLLTVLGGAALLFVALK